MKKEWLRSLRTSGSVAHVCRKQLRARLETRGGRISPSAFICRWAKHASFRQFSKINISL